MPFWWELTQARFLKAAEETEVAVMQTGALEAHGTHLPLGTDTILPSYLAEAVAERTRALVLPPIPFGDSWTFDLFQGTVSITPITLINFYAEVMDAVFRQGFRFIVALNGHGGNTSHLQHAAQKATMKGERAVIIVNWWVDLGKQARQEVLESEEGHAAEDETSEALFVCPNLVDMSAIKAEKITPRFRIISAGYRSELYPSAIYGDPRKADGEKGRRIMEQAADELVELIVKLERGEIPFTED